ncbi:Kinesin-like protein KIF13A [Takifugu flavidus]|uniref:Kinesin-like protein KIF13A n=1 Tax=Takifugu flavidus TaxID=433684 RepID=A0A5C6NJS4_9TELE|nr:Kinesin-like protein KIF13A [Takifugu flavidus]
MGEPSLDDSNVKVAVRVRPMNRREKELNTKCVVEMVKNQTILHPSSLNLGKGDSRLCDDLPASLPAAMRSTDLDGSFRLFGLLK